MQGLIDAVPAAAAAAASDLHGAWMIPSCHGEGYTVREKTSHHLLHLPEQTVNTQGSVNASIMSMHSMPSPVHVSTDVTCPRPSWQLQPLASISEHPIRPLLPVSISTRIMLPEIYIRRCQVYREFGPLQLERRRVEKEICTRNENLSIPVGFTKQKGF